MDVVARGARFASVQALKGPSPNEFVENTQTVSQVRERDVEGLLSTIDRPALA